jgi:hypothetical protein
LQVIIWDKIVQSPKDAVLKYKKELVKFVSLIIAAEVKEEKDRKFKRLT